MTLQQLKYVSYIADCGSISKAAEIAYISQPSLSASLKELEKEIGIEIFKRNNRGLTITAKGSDFLSYARQVIEQYNLIEDKYINKKGIKQKFSVSSQHYSFAVKAFINMVKHFGMDEYEFSIRETKTKEVIDDVRQLRSELGILYLNSFNNTILTKIFNDYSLEFKSLFKCKVFVYLYKGNPLSNQKRINIKQLEKYPCLSFEQGNNNSFYFAEEVLSTYKYKQLIKANDRGTMLNLMKGLNGYTLCSGILSEELNGNEYVAVPLDSDEIMEIGYIKKIAVPLSDLGQKYLEEINEIRKQK